MRQGIVIFADAPPQPGLKPTVEAALATGAGAFLAYGRSESSAALRTLLGGPPPRFFPQASRNTLGERMSQAFAFLFVQDFERVLLLTGSAPDLSAAELSAALSALDDEPVVLAGQDGAYLVALRRADFPHVAAIFEDVAWDKPGAREHAERLLAEASAKAK